MRLLLFLFLAASGFAAVPLSDGLREVARNKNSSGAVLIIPGVHETGGTWQDIIPTIRARRVYYLEWEIKGRDAVKNPILAAIESIPGKVVVIAHSASRVFLYGVIARNPELATRVSCHIIAAPLGGYGMYPSGLFAPLIPYAYFGGQIRFPAAALNTTLYVTSLRGDSAMRSIAGWGSRGLSPLRTCSGGGCLPQAKPISWVLLGNLESLSPTPTCMTGMRA